MIPDITPVNTWAGNGSNITFDFDFLINKESELQVLHTSKDGIQTELQLNKDYTIYQIGNENGSYITFPILGSSYSVLSDDEKISLVLNIPKAQTSPYGTSSKLNLTALEHSLDYIVRLIQMVDRKADRAVKVQEGSDISPEKLINSLKQSEINSRDYAQTAIDKALDAEESAQTAKEQADIATQKTQEVADLYDGAIVDITQRHNTAINEINKLHESVNIDIDSINTVKEEALNNVIAEGQNQIELIKEQGSSYATKEDAKYTAGNGIDITDNIISNTQTSAEWGNITGNIENQEDLVNYVKKYSGGLEVCDIGMSLYIDETKGLRRWLNGQIVDINANTQAFLDRLKQIVALYPSLSCTEEEWQSIKSASAFGQVGKFVFNYNPELIIEVVSVRIPAVVNVQGLFDLQNLGMTVEAGLPNIEGSFGSVLRSFFDMGSRNNVSGCVTAKFSEGSARTQGSTVYNSLLFGVDASSSNPIFGNSDTVQPEAIQYPYFIQIATGQETENNIINEIELNNPFSLFDSKYSDHELNNLSWLKSEGQWNAKAVYPTAYDKLLKVYNGTETVEGLSVKLSTEEYTDYDFVLNTADETFRLPLLDGSENVPDFGASPTLITQNWVQGTQYTAPKNGHFQVATSATGAGQFINYVVDSSYTFNSVSSANGLANVDMIPVSRGSVLTISTSFGGSKGTIYFYPNTGNGSLYYYVGETVQNANLIDAGRMQEQITNINAPSRGYLVQSYVNGTSGYRVYSDGWCEQWGKSNRTSGQETITLTKAYNSINFTVLATSYTNNFYGTAQIINNKTIWIESRGHDFTVQPCLVRWLTMGYIS